MNARSEMTMAHYWMVFVVVAVLSVVDDASASFPLCSTLPPPICACGKPPHEPPGSKGLCYACHTCNSCFNCKRCATCVCNKPEGCETPPSPPPPPTPPPPPQWLAKINRSAMMYSNISVFDQGLPLYPVRRDLNQGCQK